MFRKAARVGHDKTRGVKLAPFFFFRANEETYFAISEIATDTILFQKHSEVIYRKSAVGADGNDCRWFAVGLKQPKVQHLKPEVDHYLLDEQVIKKEFGVVAKQADVQNGVH